VSVWYTLQKLGNVGAARSPTTPGAARQKKLKQRLFEFRHHMPLHEIDFHIVRQD
jgi:hypothetical protein